MSGRRYSTDTADLFEGAPLEAPRSVPPSVARTWGQQPDLFAPPVRTGRIGEEEEGEEGGDEPPSGPPGSLAYWTLSDGWRGEPGPGVDYGTDQWPSPGPMPDGWDRLDDLARWITLVELRRSWAWSCERAERDVRRGMTPDIPLDRLAYPRNPYRAAIRRALEESVRAALGKHHGGGWDTAGRALAGDLSKRGAAVAWRWAREHRGRSEVADTMIQRTVAGDVNAVIRAAHPSREDTLEIVRPLHQGHGGSWVHRDQLPGGPQPGYWHRDRLERRALGRWELILHPERLPIQSRAWYLENGARALMLHTEGGRARARTLAEWAAAQSDPAWVERAVRYMVRCEVGGQGAAILHALPWLVGWRPRRSGAHTEWGLVVARFQAADYRERKGRVRMILGGHPIRTGTADHPSLAVVQEDLLVQGYARLAGINLSPEQPTLF